MKKFILKFPDFSSMADFAIKHKIKGAEVNAYQQTMAAVLSEDQLKIASLKYGAELKHALVHSYSK